MDLKRFKHFRQAEKTVKVYNIGENCIKVNETFSAFSIYLNDSLVEHFKTKDMALLVAEQTFQALGQKE